MTEGRIQDWIRYVHDRAEHVEESQEQPDSQTPDKSADESSSHNTSQSASQHAPQPGTPTSQNGPVLSRPASAASASLGLPAREGLPSREGRILPSLTAQAVRRSVARARSLAAQAAEAPATPTEKVAPEVENPTPDAQLLETENSAETENFAVETAILLPKTRRGRRSKSDLAENGDALSQNGAAKMRQRVRQKPETRAEMLDRLMNPTISLYEASVLLDVCAATVRRYTNSGLLPHVRTEGGQRRFRLRDVLALLQEQEKKY